MFSPSSAASYSFQRGQWPGTFCVVLFYMLNYLFVRVSFFLLFSFIMNGDGYVYCA